MISQEKPWMKYYKNLPDVSVAECKAYTLMYERNKDHPNDIALNYFDHEITFGEMFEQIRLTANAFSKHGVKAGEIVSVCSVKTPEIIYAYYALDYLGAVGNIIDPRTSTSGVKEYFVQTETRIVLSLDVAYPRVVEAAKGTMVEEIIVVSPADSLTGLKKIGYKLKNRDNNVYAANAIRWGNFIASGSGIAAAEEPYDPNHAAIIVRTGGTTGHTKGVLLPDKAFNALALQYGINNFERHHKFLDVMPPFIAYGFACGTHLPLCFGVTDVIVPACAEEEFNNLVLKYKPAHMAATPLHYINMANSQKMKGVDFSFLLTPGAGGDAMNPSGEKLVNEFLEAHHCNSYVAKGWGMTECCSTVSTCMGKKIYKYGSVGIPLCFTTVSVFDPDTGEELGYNEEGELCVQSPDLMLGYFKNEAETERVLQRHKDGKIWLHTGDIGRIDEDGFVFIISRIKRIIIRHDGFKVYPSVIEKAASIYEGVADCSAVGVRNLNFRQGDEPVIFIVLKEEYRDRQDLAAEEIRKVCEANLPEYELPARYYFLEKLPYTPIGKVDYRALEAKALDLIF